MTANFGVKRENAAGNSAQGKPATPVFFSEFVDGSLSFLPVHQQPTSVRKIRVGWRDILCGEQSRPSACPVSRSLKRIGFGCSLVRTRDLLTPFARVDLPEETQRFIERFDEFNGPRWARPFFFRPFTFELELPLL